MSGAAQMSAAGAPAASALSPRRPANLRLEQVSRWYGDVLALDAVDLTLGPGVTGLLGPNGAGKSTLIRLVTGMASVGSGTGRWLGERRAAVPAGGGAAGGGAIGGAAAAATSPVTDAGRVLLDGESVRNDLAALARIGFVPDGDGLYEELSARRFLVDQARLRGFTRADAARRAEECLQRVGLSAAADRRAGGFSKGMRQRLKLAQAILHDPDVLVLDEPLTGLDPVMRRDFIRVVRELGDEGVTVLVSSHVLHEVEAMTDGVVLLHHGQVLAEGTVPHIRDLLETHARRIRVSVADPRALARSLLERDGLISGLELLPEALVVETLRPDQLCGALQELAVAGAFTVNALEPLDEDLGSVFSYLVD